MPGCGDGILHPGEECDDGNEDNTDLCLDTCVAASCGDGYVGPGETCDDGNFDGWRRVLEPLRSPDLRRRLPRRRRRECDDGNTAADDGA
ncbi:MAG: DUF4215 domain-containing protein [Sandaracinaceae bacterium]